MDYSKCVIGLEFGSTRIKAVLLDENLQVAAQGAHDWENKLENGIWTYDMEEVYAGLQHCYSELKKDAERKFGEVLKRPGALGISGMMHGYLPFDREGNQLCGFRTWRNTITGPAAAELTEYFGFNIPQRWSIAHLYQAVLNQEEHVEKLGHLTTLAGHIHHLLTGEWCMGIGEAAGMFPIDSQKMDFRSDMLDKFDRKVSEKGYSWKIREVLPKVVCAGEYAGVLTAEGAALLDPAGDLEAGIPLAPCEGDAGTGMTATNSVRVYTGNVSAGTSDFAMIVTDHELGVHREIDMVTTPSGAPVAMVHCNNCTSDINDWVALFGRFAEAIGHPVDKGDLFTLLFNMALKGDRDCGGLLNYNYYSGEGVTDVDEGRPVFLRQPDASFTPENLMRSHMMSALSTLKIGLDILINDEYVRVDKLYGHGGFFKTPGVGQTFLSAAVKAPVSCMETAGEGGPYGMALLAAFLIMKKEGESLEDFLEEKVFSSAKVTELMASDADIEDFDAYLERYRRGFGIELEAIRSL